MVFLVTNINLAFLCHISTRLLLQYEGKSDSLNVAATGEYNTIAKYIHEITCMPPRHQGSGGLAELKTQLKSDQACYAYVR